MNILVLASVFATVPLRSRLRLLWVPLLAVCAFSTEIQIVSLLHLNGLTALTVLNVCALAVALAFRSARERLRQFYVDAFHQLVSMFDLLRGVRGVIDWLVIGAVVVLAGFLTFYALSHVPYGGDPYHLARVYLLQHKGNVAYIPTRDYKDITFGYLYELGLVDARLIPLLGDLALRLVNPLSFLLLVLMTLVLYKKARGGAGGDLYLWVGLAFMPVFIYHFILLKNDFLTFVFGFISLYVLYKANNETSDEVLLLSGLAAGLSFSVKSATVALPVLAVLFLPYASWRGFFRTRIAWGIGGLLGLLLGGYIFLAVNNYLFYGNFVGPLQGALGIYAPASLQDSLVSVVRLVASVLDWRRIPGPLPPYDNFLVDGGRKLQWPTSVGGQLGWLFTFLLVIYFVLAARFRKGFRLGAICIGYSLMLAVIYIYLDIDHRRLMIPALLLSSETVGWLVGLHKTIAVRVARFAILAGVVLSFLFGMYAVGASINNSGLLNDLEVAAGVAGIDAADLNAVNAPVCYDYQVKLRAIGRFARQSKTCVAYYRQENALWMDGISQLVPLVDMSARLSLSQGYEQCDFFVFDPNVLLAQSKLPTGLRQRLAGCLPPRRVIAAAAACGEPVIGLQCPAQPHP